jgi:nitrogen fixation-related uncharacterized protein
MSAILTIWIFMTILGLTSIGALVWAIQAGQFHSIGDGAESIFDADEPIGSVTDRFPVSAASKKATESRKAGNL